MSDFKMRFTVMQRARGVWLAHWQEDQQGVADFDAFPTEGEAKRWCAKAANRQRLPWRSMSKPGQRPWFMAELDVDVA